MSFAQYKLAVQTYVSFLADLESKPIEVPFPDESACLLVKSVLRVGTTLVEPSKLLFPNLGRLMVFK